jgi:hypothetical protein
MHDPFGFGDKPQKNKRTTISKSEWETLKHTLGNKCVLCGKSEKAVVELQKAHIRAASKSGTTVLPLCPICHRKFDKGKATDAELKKLKLTRAQYNRMIPKPGTVKGKSKSNTDTDIPKYNFPSFDLPSYEGSKRIRKKKK